MIQLRVAHYIAKKERLNFINESMPVFFYEINEHLVNKVVTTEAAAPQAYIKHIPY